MAALVAALQFLGITAEVELGGRWVALHGERGTAYVIEAGWGSSFYVWSDLPEERAVARYADPVTALQEGLRRAAGQPPEAREETPPDTA
jgi:hypothetical protein